jgi:hypothetical protein
MGVITRVAILSGLKALVYVKSLVSGTENTYFGIRWYFHCGYFMSHDL